MGEFEAAPWERSDHANVNAIVNVDTNVNAIVNARAGAATANVMDGTYNPGGGIRVQRTWQRFSNSPRQHASRPYGRPAGPVRPASPADCR